MAKILLAEDDTSMRLFLEAALSRSGHSVISCENGLDALAEIDARAFDILVLDIIMPGMDGIALSHHALEKHPRTKVVFITGFSAVLANSNAAPAHVFSKPFHLKELVDEVGKLARQ